MKNIIDLRQRDIHLSRSIAQVAESAEVAMSGKAVSRTLEGDRGFDVLVKYDDSSRRDLENIRSNSP